MAVTFIQMVTRIASDLRRSNLTQQIKDGINDAITEAAKTRFYFNEIEYGFSGVYGQQDYVNQFGIVELDHAWRVFGLPVQQETLEIINDRTMDRYLEGSTPYGIPNKISVFRGKFRLNPPPDSPDYLFVLKGYGKLSPFPLTLDAHSNAWLDDGELYIRELAKRNVLRDVIRDYGEATAREAIAEDYKQQLIEETNSRNSLSTLRATKF